MRTRAEANRQRWAILGFAVAILLLSFVVLKSAYYQLVLTQVLLWAVLSLAWNMLCGYSGYFSFGHAVFWGVRRAGLTLAGNKRARRVLIEGAWSYRYPARVSQTLQARLEGLPKAVREIAWKAQIRLCARYRRLNAAGKKLPVVIAAIAREMAAFMWAIASHVSPAAC